MNNKNMKKNEMFIDIEKLFFNKSFGDVSTKNIADLFGINKASLYYYFKSKEILFSELLDFSFENYLNHLKQISNLDLNDFILNYINYPFESKNLFATINETGFCENDLFLTNIKIKQEKLYNYLFENFKGKYGFTKEKTFILISLLDSLARKKCISVGCIIDTKKIFLEIKTLFIN